MLLKALAVVRTGFLAFLVYFTISGTPIFIGLPSDIIEPYQRCKAGLDAITGAIWMAIGWIAFETLVGWWFVTRDGAKKALAGANAPRPGSSEPPFAPPR